MKMVRRNANMVVGILLIAVMSIAVSCSKSGPAGANTTPKPPPADATHIYLQDSAFKAYLQANVCPDAFDKYGRLDINNGEVTGFTGSMLIDSTYKIYSLNGIAYFSKMSKLTIQSSLVDSLDLSTTMAIDTLRLLANVDLQYVNVKGCSAMRYIKFYNIPVTVFDLSNLPALNMISGQSSGRLSTLKVDNDANLQHIICFGLTALTTVNTATCPNLQHLFLDVCYAVTSLDLTNNPQLKSLEVSFATGFKKVDLSGNPALALVNFDETAIDTLDFSHNPALFSLSMTYTPIRNVSFLSNPNLRSLSLDGCGSLQTADLRAQKSFNFYIIDKTKIPNYTHLTEADLNEMFPDGEGSPTPGGMFTIADSATRKVEGASMDIFGGLRVPQYLDADYLNLANVKINDACKNNYSLVMARRTDGFVPQAVITVYAADTTTVLCANYGPELEVCN